MSPPLALAVRSWLKRSSAVVPLGPSAVSPAGVSAAATPEPSIGRRLPSSDCRQMLRWPTATSSTGILANSCEMLMSARRSSSDFSAATSTWPVRICVSPNSSVA